MCISQTEITGVDCSGHCLQKVFPIVFNQQHRLLVEVHINNGAFSTDQLPWCGCFIVLCVFGDLFRERLGEVHDGVEKRTIEQDLAVVQWDNVGEGVEVLDIV